MEISRRTIERIASVIPGDCAVYSTAKDGVVRTLYYSPGIPALSGRTPEEYEREVAVCALDAVVADDRNNLRAFFSGATEEQECYYRLWNRDKSKGFTWIHVKGRTLGEMDGCPVTLVIFLNSTREAVLYQTLLDHANSKIMVVDRASRKILYANTPVLGGQGIGYADAKCYELKNKQTGPCADCIIDKLQNAGEIREEEFENKKDGVYEHVSAEFINWCGREACVLCTYDVTSQKLAEKRYESALHELLSVSPHTLCAFRLNLTKNDCGHPYGISRRIKKLLQAETADGLFENAANLIEDEDEKKLFRAKFSRHLLLNAFGCGETRVVHSYRRLSDNGEMRWVSLYVNMMHNPRTGDVEAVAYSLDANDSKRGEMIIQRIAAMEYDYICTVDAVTHRITYRRLGSGARATYVYDTLDYDKDLSESINVSMAPEEAGRRAGLLRSKISLRSWAKASFTASSVLSAMRTA